MKASNAPVYLSLAGLARLIGAHHQDAGRAWHHGYIDPAVFIGDQPGFPAEAADGLRRYLAAKDTRLGRHLPAVNAARLRAKEAQA